MKHGIAYKNLTDTIVLAAAIIALICVLLSIISFGKPYTVKDPVTGVDIEVKGPLDDPYNITYLKLCGIFTLTALVGFIARKWLLFSIVASLCSIVISFVYFLDGSVGDYGFLYVFCGIVGFAGNIIHMVLTDSENKAKFKEMVREKRKERLASEGKSKRK